MESFTADADTKYAGASAGCDGRNECIETFDFTAAAVVVVGVMAPNLLYTTFVAAVAVGLVVLVLVLVIASVFLRFPIPVSPNTLSIKLVLSPSPCP